MTPIVPGIGYTAPIFAKTLRVQSVPRTFCVVSGGDYRNTEQSEGRQGFVRNAAT